MINVEEYLNQPATLKTTSYDEYSDLVVLYEEDILVRFRKDFSIERLSSNEELKLDGKFYTFPSQDVSIDQILEYEGQEYRVVKVKEARGFDGELNHKVCYVTIV